MDRLFRALSLSSLTQNSSSIKDLKKSEKLEKSLQDWKLSHSSASDVFKGSKNLKIVEKEIHISEDYSTFPLFTDNLQRVHLSDIEELDLHMGMIQVGLKATKLGSDTSAIICLRDKRVLEFHESILGMVESSLCDAPIYFYYFPKADHEVSLADPNLSSAFTIDVKLNGSSQNIILMYRFHYKLLHSHDYSSWKLRMPSGLVRDVKGETTLFLPNLAARSNHVVSKKVYWDQLVVPERWMVRNNTNADEGAARVDWKETAEAHVLKVDVPGFKKEEVVVEVEDGNILQISGERSKEEEEEEEEKWHCEERSSGKFLRSFRMPENAKLGLVKAGVKNGVLTVTVPKKGVDEKPEVKVIDVSG